ncbi:adenosine deaminase [Vreelandella populi]|uniref:Adenine deaminase n=1 Tax=Vreelandella populi TaxID=2498858 RepID=A0A433LGM8_9GAMM|nr:adenosine deaminase [Halomonas populi]RUR40672.1 adenosine deaminase [Halomonas populi]RUR49178.1 adenosine deaminase [Halomonas populi]RUR55669.1 adenosine deaminase [Halomonas populi]
MQDFLRSLPKVELHLHIEGSLEPELMFELAERNGIELPYLSVDEAKAAYQFKDLQGFLNLYYQGMSVLCFEQDFYDLAMDYFKRASSEGVVHIDMHFDPQAHLQRGVSLNVVMSGLLRAKQEAEQSLDLSVGMIMAFLRDRPAEEALQVLEQAAPYWDELDAVGLDSAERDHPPSKFVAVFERAKELGLARVAHAGEEGPASYIIEALDLLDVCRIDHGIRCLERDDVVERLYQQQTVLTVCPLSNVSLKVVDELTNHPLPALLDKGLNVTISSDDPAYFGGGLLANHIACAQAFGWDEEAFQALNRNAVKEAFTSESRRQELLARLDVIEC